MLTFNRALGQDPTCVTQSRMFTPTRSISAIDSVPLCMITLRDRFQRIEELLHPPQGSEGGSKTAQLVAMTQERTTGALTAFAGVWSST